MLALAGAALLVISDVLPLYAVVVGTPGEEVRSVAGWSVHAFAMLLFGAAAVPMALGALRGARPAMAALVALGVVAVVIVLTVDLPAARQAGELREAVAFEDARAEPRLGFFLATLGGVLLLGAGGGMLLAGRGAPPRERRRERDGALADAP